MYAMHAEQRLDCGHLLDLARKHCRVEISSTAMNLEHVVGARCREVVRCSGFVRGLAMCWQIFSALGWPCATGPREVRRVSRQGSMLSLWQCVEPLLREAKRYPEGLLGEVGGEGMGVAAPSHPC